MFAFHLLPIDANSIIKNVCLRLHLSRNVFQLLIKENICCGGRRPNLMSLYVEALPCNGAAS